VEVGNDVSERDWQRGDVIYTGTPGATSAMKPGDVVEAGIDGIGILRNRAVG